MLSSAPCGSRPHVPLTLAQERMRESAAIVPPHQLYLPFPALLSCPCNSTKTFRKHGTFSDTKLTSWATRWEVLQGWEQDSDLPLEVREAGGVPHTCWD